MLLDAAIVVNIATEQTSSYILVTLDADEVVIILEGGGQLPLAWRQVRWCRSVVLISSGCKFHFEFSNSLLESLVVALGWVPIYVWDVESGDV